VQGDIAEYLRRFSPDAQGYIPLTPDQMAAQTGYARVKVNKSLFNLMSRGRIELIRGPNGRAIIGYRNLDAPDRRRRSNGTTPTPERVRLATPVVVPPAQPRPRGIMTPALDEYTRAKGRFNQLVNELGPLVEARFEENRYAEEGLRLRDRLNLIEPQFGQLRRELDEANRDLRVLRGRKQAEMTEAAITAGAMVQHGD
jgi:hypothetical protein